MTTPIKSLAIKKLLAVTLFSCTITSPAFADTLANDHQTDQLINQLLSHDIELPSQDIASPIPVITPTDKTNTPTKNGINSLIEYAKTLIGTPYKAGGSSPNGFDCSGFMHYVFQKIGISLPRSSKDMATVGNPIGKHELQLGDMVFFAHNGKRISHVGMYVGNGQFIHSPSSGKSVEITALDGHYWESRFVTARRIRL